VLAEVEYNANVSHRQAELAEWLSTYGYV
jgi:hypothetical protein